MPQAIRVFSPVQGFVMQRYVKEGDSVKRGDPVYLLDVSRSTRQGVVSDNQHAHIEQQLARIDSIVMQLNASKEATLALLKRQQTQYEVALTQSTAIIKKAEEGIRIMKLNMDNYRRYQADGLINRDQLINQTSLYYQQQNNLLSFSSQSQQNALQLSSVESEMQTQAAEFDSRINQMEI